MGTGERTDAGGAPAGRGVTRRLIAFYAIVAIATAAVTIYVINRGSGEHAQPSIAGGYDVQGPNPCIGPLPVAAVGAPLPATAPAQPVASGPQFDVQQSGQFVNLTNLRQTLGGKLRLHPTTLAGGGHRLTGSVSCANGRSLQMDAVAVPGVKGAIAGSLGGSPFSASLKRDPPDPGSPLPRIPPSISGIYKVSPRSTCFGGSFTLAGSGARYRLAGNGTALGSVGYASATGALAGDVACVRGGHARLRASAVDLNLNNVTVIPLDAAAPAAVAAGSKPLPKPLLTTPSGLPPSGERFTAVKQRSEFSKLVAAFFLAVMVVIVVARLFGILAVKVGQPRVMGEVIAGICLGPSLFGALAPTLQSRIFPSDILPTFGVVANLGLIFYMFLIGLELDRSQLKGRVMQAAVISNASIALPMMLGMAAALPLYELVGPNKKFVAFALFMGVAMSITAFPVLARILAERRMIKRPVGALALGCAAIDDVTAWFLIALATTVAVAGSFGEVAKTIGEAVAFVLVMALVVRPIIARLSTAFDEVGRIPGGWIVAIFAGVLLSAYVTEEINIAVIFGGFVMGMVMPRNARLTEEVTRRVEDFVVFLLLPMFFVYTGLKTNVGLLNQPILWEITVGLIAIAIIGKLVGAAAAARVSGFDWRASAVIGTLMNTRGLTELIVLNLALERGAISNALFAALVLMALVTTLMAGPMLKLLDRENTFGLKIEDEFAAARARLAAEYPGLVVPEHSILVAPQTDAALPQLLALAEPLARSQPPRELILVRLVTPPRGAGVRGGLQTENAALERATVAVNTARRRLIDDGIAARAVVLRSTTPGQDLAHIVAHEPVDLVLVEGRRPLLGDGVPLGEVTDLLRSAPCDVSVLVAREEQPIKLGPDAPILVPFGGAEHDWSALELGSWLAAQTGAPLRLLGAAGRTEEGPGVTRMLADAGLLAQQFAGVSTQPLLVEGGRDGIVEAARGAGLLVIGLSDRWRKEGLGPTRAEIAKAAPAPVLFVRRGSRPGALAPRGEVTRFGWSLAGAGGQAAAFLAGGDEPVSDGRRDS
jgi:Kef-type K+ transport system membrane component KefB